MAGTLLFIHGTGVRSAGFEQTMGQLRKGLDGAGLEDVVLEGLSWGEALGVKLDRIALDAVSPPAAARATVDSIDDADWRAALWGQLLLDPLFELRMAAIRQASAAAEPVGVPMPTRQLSPGVDMQQRLQAVAMGVADPLPGGVAAADLQLAVAWLRPQPTLLAAAGGPIDGDLVQAVSRAVVARALSQARGPFGQGPDALFLAATRDELTAEVARLIGPETRAIGGWLFRAVKGFAEARATAFGKNHQLELMRGASPGVGDILLYQRRGGLILQAIEDKILGLPNRGPLVVLGHSLGGVMLVDLLSRPKPLPVARLITVASQSPVFFKCDGLETLRPSHPLPAGAPFTPWLNVFDRNDFLSFCASRAFAAGTLRDVEDFEMSSGVPFPDSHGAYFRMHELYDKIAATWP